MNEQADFNRMNDRCDSCGAEALAGVDNGMFDLIFCRHHYFEFKSALEAQGFLLVVDRLNKYDNQKQQMLQGSDH